MVGAIIGDDMIIFYNYKDQKLSYHPLCQYYSKEKFVAQKTRYVRAFLSGVSDHSEDFSDSEIVKIPYRAIASGFEKMLGAYLSKAELADVGPEKFMMFVRDFCNSTSKDRDFIVPTEWDTVMADAAFPA